MESMTSEQCIEAIQQERTFHAVIDDGALTVKIERYTWFVCTAIHAGHAMRAGLVEKCALSEAERLFEEDPYTDTIASNMPITVVGGDSRFEYDLNRAPDNCIYEEAWGKTVWKEPLTDAEKTESLGKYDTFYKVLGALYRKLESLHPVVLGYDVHSYNCQRPGMGDVPLFNIGTEQLDLARWQNVIDHWASMLNDIHLPGVDVRAAINEVFYGRGYQATFVREHFSNTLVLPTEAKKAFMDENTGQPDTAILENLQTAFEHAIEKHAADFPAMDTRPVSPRL